MIRKKEKAKFIALEGGEGAGKSTQARILTERLQANGIQTIEIHEPGTTSLGLHLRTFLKGNHPISPEAEMLLFGASRAQLADEIIRPKLEQGVTVVADRFEASSMAYQGHAQRPGSSEREDDQRLRHQGNPPGPEHPVGPGAEHRTGPHQGGHSRTQRRNQQKRESGRTRQEPAGSRSSPSNSTREYKLDTWPKSERNPKDGQ